MPRIEVRPFRRTDRDQLTELVNAHVGAVLPGVSVSVNAVMSQLEREPGEYVVDPWAIARETHVAVVRDRVVAAAHLMRYGAGDEVGRDYRDAGELRWLVAWPGGEAAADALVAACLDVLAAWGVARTYADGALPAPGVYGIPDCWPHLRGVLERAGFARGDREEVVLLAAVDELPRAAPPPVAGLAVRRELGRHATRFSAVLDGRVVGFHEVAADLTLGGSRSRLAGWGDVWELWVAPEQRRRGIARWLLGHGADWLRLARVERVLAYAAVGEDEGLLALLPRCGWRELVRTRRGWER